MIAEQFAEQLRVAVQEALWAGGIEQAELARRAGLSQAMVSRFWRRERSVSLEMADAILGALGLAVAIQPRREREED
jgi:transcriptional regulator with XRE-family HTH domain